VDGIFFVGWYFPGFFQTQIEGLSGLPMVD